MAAAPTGGEATSTDGDATSPPDPWAPPAAVHDRPARRPRSSLAPWIAALALGATGPALRVLLRDGTEVAGVLVAVAATAIAVGALVRPLPLRRATAEPSPASLAVPALAFAGISWYRHGDLGPTLVALVVAGAIVGLYLRWPQHLARPDAWLTSGVATLARSVAAAIVFVVLVVVLYLPGAVVAAVDALVRRTRSARTSTWHVVSVSVEEQRRDAPYPFATTPAGQARRRLAVGLVLLVIVPTIAWWVL
jgi:hypothetical protein